MKKLAASFLILFSLSYYAFAQEIDTIPIETKDMDLKLKRSPLPSRQSVLHYEPVNIKPIVVNAKVNYWKQKTALTLNVNQALFTNNWKGGGVNSIAVGGLLNWKAEYNKSNYSYVSEVILQYGKVKNKNQLQKKTSDRIYWDNKASIQLSKNWFFFGSINFESQFDNGYTYTKDAEGAEKATLISKFMGPGYLTESFGFEYKPVNYFSTRIGTGTARQTFMLDSTLYKTNPKNFGVPHGKRFRNELAFQVVANYEKEVIKNATIKSRYMIFVPYENLTLNRITHRLDLNLTAKINRFMNTSLTGVLLYDRDMDTEIQASQTLALGFTFIFPR